MLDNQNFRAFAGATKELHITLTEDSSPLNLLNAVLVWVLKETPVSPTLIEKGMGDFVITDNIVEFVLTPAETANLVDGDYYHEMAMEDVLGNVTVLLRGTATIERSGAL